MVAYAISAVPDDAALAQLLDLLTSHPLLAKRLKARAEAATKPTEGAEAEGPKKPWVN